MVVMLDYLNQTLGLNAKISPWEEAERLPLYLRSGYRSICGAGENILFCILAKRNVFLLKQIRTALACPHFVSRWKNCLFCQNISLYAPSAWIPGSEKR